MSGAASFRVPGFLSMVTSLCSALEKQLQLFPIYMDRSERRGEEKGKSTGQKEDGIGVYGGVMMGEKVIWGRI